MFWRGVVGYLPMNIVQGLVGFFAIFVFTRALTPAEFGFYAPEAQAGRLADHFATLYRGWLGAAVVFVAAGTTALLLWPGDAPIKVAVAVGMAATLARSLAKLNQERRRAAGDVRG